MIKDIVCGNDVNMDRERYRSWHEGQEFWFDTRQCKNLFDEHPEKYLRTEVKSESERTKAEDEFSEIGKKTLHRSKGYAKSVVSERKGYVADTAGGISKALHDASKSLKDEHHDDSARLVDRAADELDRLSTKFRDEDADTLISDAEDYVRGNPGLSIGGALAAGFLLARFIKSGSEVSHH